MKIRLATTKLTKDSIVDGEGIRTVIWTQGCPHNCAGCHNPETHDFNAGYLIDIEKVKKSIEILEGQDGVTFSGGDPMLQPLPCSEIAKFCHLLGLNVWCYTGYSYEKLLEMSENNPDIMSFLKQIDVLVDGKFIKEEKSFDLKFKGSKNLRIIDVPISLLKKEVVLKYDDDKKTTNKGRKNKYMFV